MTMRVSTQMLYLNFNSDLQANLNSYYKDQEKVASGQKVNRNSDNPSSMITIVSGKAQLYSIEGYQNTITNANLLLDATSSAIDTFSTYISDAKSIALEYDPDNADSYIEMMNNYIEGVISTGNTKYGNRYIFSGSAYDKAAIDSDTGMYVGNSARVSMQVSDSTDIDVNVAGNEFIAYSSAAATAEGSALLSSDNTDMGLVTASDDITSTSDVYSENGGTLSISGGGTTSSVSIAAGATLSDVADAINTVSGTTGVTATVVDANSGSTPADYKIMLSVSSPSTADDISVTVTTDDEDDTGLNRIAGSGMDSVFSINGGALDISLNGGAATSVTIPAGATWSDVVEAINDAGTGVRAEAINADATGSTDDYRIVLSASPDSTASQISVSATTSDDAGTGLNLLSSSSMSGVTNPDTTIIGAMSILRTAIELGDEDAVQRAYDYLDAVGTKTLAVQSEVGVRQSRVEQESDYLSTKDANITDAVADKLTLSEAELAAVVVDAQQKQTQLEALRSLSASFLQTSLFDYL
jgi:flagellar hook-associated protein 3 FlgL